MKAYELTPRDLYCVLPVVGLREPRGFLIAIQKSADGIVFARDKRLVVSAAFCG